MKLIISITNIDKSNREQECGAETRHNDMINPL